VESCRPASVGASGEVVDGCAWMLGVRLSFRIIAIRRFSLPTATGTRFLADPRLRIPCGTVTGASGSRSPPPTLLPVGRAAGRLSEQSCNSCRSAGRDPVRFHLSARDCASSRCWARRPSRLQIGSRHSSRSDAALGRADDGRGQSACQRHGVTTPRWSSSTIATVTGSSRVRRSS
jgi:hypothetical protein